MTKAAAKLKSAPTVKVEDDYLDLVRSFPLRPLRSATEFTAAGEVLDHYIGREDLTAGQRDYLAALVRFVEDYENEHRIAKLKRFAPLELIKHLMEENDLNTADLGQILGSRGLASEILNRNRGLSTALIGKLAARFKVEPGLFLDVAQPE